MHDLTLRAAAPAALLAALTLGLSACGSDQSNPTGGGSNGASPSDASSTTDDPTDDQTDDQTGTSATVSVAEVTDQLTREFRKRTGIDGTVDCGDESEWSAPSKHRCIIGGEEVQVVAAVKVAADGTITWHMK